MSRKSVLPTKRTPIGRIDKVETDWGKVIGGIITGIIVLGILVSLAGA